MFKGEGGKEAVLVGWSHTTVSYLRCFTVPIRGGQEDDHFYTVPIGFGTFTPL